MKFEIDPNELTTDQRAHVAAFITNWPRDLYGKAPGDAVLKVEPTEETILKRGEPFEQHAAVTYEHVTEEHRLDAEQKRDMDTTGELREISRAAQADNLDAIFGTPTATERLELGANLNSLVPLDKEGLPWDSRIHSSSKATIADGSWKLRRGVDPISVDMVKHQLKELMAVPVVTGMDVPAPVFTPAPTPVVTIGSASTVPVPPAPKSHYLIDQDPTISANQQPVTLTDLIGRMSAAIAAGKLTQANVTEMCVKHGVSEFFLLGNRPDLFPLIDADMKAMGV